MAPAKKRRISAHRTQKYPNGTALSKVFDDHATTTGSEPRPFDGIIQRFEFCKDSNKWMYLVLYPEDDDIEHMTEKQVGIHVKQYKEQNSTLAPQQSIPTGTVIFRLIYRQAEDEPIGDFFPHQGTVQHFLFRPDSQDWRYRVHYQIVDDEDGDQYGVAAALEPHYEPMFLSQEDVAECMKPSAEYLLKEHLGLSMFGLPINDFQHFSSDHIDWETFLNDLQREPSLPSIQVGSVVVSIQEGFTPAYALHFVLLVRDVPSKVIDKLISAFPEVHNRASTDFGWNSLQWLCKMQEDGVIIDPDIIGVLMTKGSPTLAEELGVDLVESETMELLIERAQGASFSEGLSAEE